MEAGPLASLLLLLTMHIESRDQSRLQRPGQLSRRAQQRSQIRAEIARPDRGGFSPLRFAPEWLVGTVSPTFAVHG
jgi:hypothetical protein